MVGIAGLIITFTILNQWGFIACFLNTSTGGFLSASWEREPSDFLEKSFNGGNRRWKTSQEGNVQMIKLSPIPPYLTPRYENSSFYILNETHFRELRLRRSVRYVTFILPLFSRAINHPKAACRSTLVHENPRDQENVNYTSTLAVTPKTFTARKHKPTIPKLLLSTEPVDSPYLLPIKQVKSTFYVTQMMTSSTRHVSFHQTFPLIHTAMQSKPTRATFQYESSIILIPPSTAPSTAPPTPEFPVNPIDADTTPVGDVMVDPEDALQGQPEPPPITYDYSLKKSSSPSPPSRPFSLWPLPTKSTYCGYSAEPSEPDTPAISTYPPVTYPTTPGMFSILGSLCPDKESNFTSASPYGGPDFVSTKKSKFFEYYDDTQDYYYEEMLA